MQRTFLPLLALAIGAVSAIPTTPQPPQISECMANCFLESYKELANGCPEDPTFMKCICKDTSKFTTVKTCLGSCNDDLTKQIIPYLDPALCEASPDDHGSDDDTVTVTQVVTVPCTTGTDIVLPTGTDVVIPTGTDIIIPTVVPPHQTGTASEVPQPPHTGTEAPPTLPSEVPSTIAEPQPPVTTEQPPAPPVTQTPVLPPAASGTTGVIPPPGSNTTVSTGQPTSTEPPISPTDGPVQQPGTGAAGKFEISAVVVGLVGVVSFFVAL